MLSREDRLSLGIVQLDGQGERISNRALLGFIRQLVGLYGPAAGGEPRQYL